MWRRVLGPLADDVSAAYDDPIFAWVEILHGVADGSILLGAA